jgi:hypothetical protein
VNWITAADEQKIKRVNLNTFSNTFSIVFVIKSEAIGHVGLLLAGLGDG